MLIVFWGTLCFVLCLPGFRAAPRIVGLAVLLFVLYELVVAIPVWWSPLHLGLQFNWLGKLLAVLLAGLVVYGLRWVSPAAVGLRRPAPGSLRVVVPVIVFFAALEFADGYYNRHHHSRPTHEGLLYQLTMPGLAEELFYRGIFPGLLSCVFPRTLPFLGARTSWGAVVALLLFVLAHALSFPTPLLLWPHSHFTMGVLGVGVWGTLFLWVRERTGSVWAAVAAHNLSNICLYAAWSMP